ncbi:hypothetical protein Tco_0397900 [Tanacetum coccineum]
MDDLNITMEEYIRLEEEKAQKCGKVFNWETAKYGRIWYNEDVHDLRSVENKFPAIVFNDSLTSNETLSCEPTVSSLNDEIDFRISFDDSDDEDYMVVFDKNLFSYKIISTNDLKTDSEKVNMPLFPSPEPTLTYKLALPPQDQRHEYLRYEGLQYTNVDIAYFETRDKQTCGFWLYTGQGERETDPRQEGEASSVIVIAHALPIIDMVKLVRLQLCFELMTLGHGYPQDLLGRREVHEELLRRLR